MSDGSAGYDKKTNVTVTAESFTIVIGPNACGKSTLLRAMARLLPATTGQVILDGTDIASLATKEVAKRLGLLPQGADAPDGITVADLVARGRYPHQRMFDRWSNADEAAVAEAMQATRVSEIAGQPVIWRAAPTCLGGDGACSKNSTTAVR